MVRSTNSEKKYNYYLVSPSPAQDSIIMVDYKITSLKEGKAMQDFLISHQTFPPTTLEHQPTFVYPNFFQLERTGVCLLSF